MQNRGRGAGWLIFAILTFVFVTGIYELVGLILSYRECTGYFSAPYCMTHPDSWSKQRAY